MKLGLHLRIVQDLAIALLLILGLKSFVDVELAWDYSAYHLPFAARIWNIVPASSFQFADDIQARFEGFPLLANVLQGMIWKACGRPEATNLVNFLAFCGYLLFLNRFFNVPAWAAALALLAVPMVQVHVTGSLADLFSNLGAAVAIMATYKLFVLTPQDYARQRWTLVLAGLAGAACAANSKLQGIPVVFVVLLFTIPRIVWLEILANRACPRPGMRRLGHALVCGIALPIIFASSIKNTLVHGNPAYPAELRVLGHSLNHAESWMIDRPEYLQTAPNWQIWAYSVLEIDVFDPDRNIRWTADQGDMAAGPKSKGWRMGGYYGPYVVFHLLLLVFCVFCLRKQREGRYALLMIIIMTACTVMLPHSHLLRYYMYWIICLISLNLALVAGDAELGRWRYKPATGSWVLATVCLLFLGKVVEQTDGVYVIPRFESLEQKLSKVVDKARISQIQPGEEVCIFDRAPYALFYASEFHGTKKYSVREARSQPECASCRRIHTEVAIH